MPRCRAGFNSLIVSVDDPHSLATVDKGRGRLTLTISYRIESLLGVCPKAAFNEGKIGELRRHTFLRKDGRHARDIAAAALEGATEESAEIGLKARHETVDARVSEGEFARPGAEGPGFLHSHAVRI